MSIARCGIKLTRYEPNWNRTGDVRQCSVLPKHQQQEGRYIYDIYVIFK